MRALIERLKEKGISFRTDVLAASLCTFRIGGRIALVIEPLCEGELCEAVMLCRQAGYPFEVLGNGSNVLFDDGYLSLAVIRTTAVDAVRVLPDGIAAGCGVPLTKLCHLAALHGFGGMTFACGIPATLGGALAMNAGAHGESMADIVENTRMLDLKTGEIKTNFNFRKNALYRNCGCEQENALFLHAELKLKKGEVPSRLLVEMRRLKAQRRASQPVELPSAGCVFKRPHPDIPIGKLLDELGCKGMRVGGAEVSEKHAAFILNKGGATAADVKKLMWEIQKKAEKERGMTLQSEIRFISNRV